MYAKLIVVAAVLLALISGIGQAQVSQDIINIVPERDGVAVRMTKDLDWGGPLQTEQDNQLSANSRGGLSGVPSTTIIIQGKIFYNDLRNDGRFDWRKDLYGNTGSQSSSRTSGSTNYLGALDVVADFYKLCDSRKVQIGSATAGPDGSYSKSFTQSEITCGGASTSTKFAIAKIGVRYRLRFCNTASDSTPDRCFSVNKNAKDDEYAGWHPYAYESNPLQIYSFKSSYTLANVAFQTSSTPGDPNDNYAQASNLYASLVESTRVWHRYNEVPFDPRGDGEVYLLYPYSTRVCTTVSATEMRCPQPASGGWVDGDGPMHEYGHVIHRRAWNGTTGGCGDCPGDPYARDGDSTWSRGSQEYPHTAFQEGWANFVSRITKDDCSELDENNATNPIYPTGGTPPIEPNEGEAYAGNVTKLLCDWYDGDTGDDDDPDRAGYGDDFEATVYSVWYNLKNTWDNASESERNDGLHICDYIDYYLNVRKSVSAVGAETHDWYEDRIANLAYNNGIGCGLEVTAPAAPSNLSVTLAYREVVATASSAAKVQPLQVGQTRLTYQRGIIALNVQGQGIERVNLQVFDLIGTRLIDQTVSGAQMRLAARNAAGCSLSNGVYLYVVTIYGYDGTTIHSEVRKLVVLR